jgi:uncharacterized protein HemY
VIVQDYPSALELLTSLKEQSTDPSRVLFHIFLAHLHSGNLNSARAALEELRTYFEGESRMERLGRILIQVGEGNWVEAERLAQADFEEQKDATVRNNTL